MFSVFAHETLNSWKCDVAYCWAEGVHRLCNRSNTDFYTSPFSLFRNLGWQEVGWRSVRLHAIYDLARWTQSGPNLQMIWFRVHVCHRMCRSAPGHAVWHRCTLLKVALWYLTRACRKHASERSSWTEWELMTCCWTMSQITDPPNSRGKVSTDLMNLDKQLLSLLLLKMSQSSGKRRKPFVRNSYLRIQEFSPVSSRMEKKKRM